LKIPGPVFYLLAAVLIGFGVWRVVLSRRPDQRRARYHLVWGVIYVLVGSWLLLTQLGVVPPPRIGQ
jgi:uncharacterized membrane protein